MVQAMQMSDVQIFLGEIRMQCVISCPPISNMFTQLPGMLNAERGIAMMPQFNAET